MARRRSRRPTSRPNSPPRWSRPRRGRCASSGRCCARTALSGRWRCSPRWSWPRRWPCSPGGAAARPVRRGRHAGHRAAAPGRGDRAAGLPGRAGPDRARPILHESLRQGRQLELRLRMALLRKLPRLNDRYFQSRPITDMADRATRPAAGRAGCRRWRCRPAARDVRAGADAGRHPARSRPRSAGLGWRRWSRRGAGRPLVQPLLNERDLRARNHAGALNGFYLDALLGLVPIRAHRAERAWRASTRACWSNGRRAVPRPGSPWALAAEGLQMALTTGLARHCCCWPLRARQGTVLGTDLLLVFWTLHLPALGGAPDRLAHAYPAHAQRAAAPAGAAGRHRTRRTATGAGNAARQRGPALHLENARRAGRRATRSCATSTWRSRRANTWPSSAARAPASRRCWGCCWAGTGCPKAGCGSTAMSSTARGSKLCAAAPPGSTPASSCGTPASSTTWATPRTRPTWRAPVPRWRRHACAACWSACRRVCRRCSAKAARCSPAARASACAWAGRCSPGAPAGAARRALPRARPPAAPRLLAEARRGGANVTLLCVTHDVGETRGFDRVLVVENGRLVEDGAPRRRWRAQLALPRAARRRDAGRRRRCGTARNGAASRVQDGRVVGSEAAP